VGLDAALDRFWEAADARRLGIDAIQVVTDNGRRGGSGHRSDDYRAPASCVSVTAHCLGPTTRILDCVWEHIVPALA
jgi:hypothetical protein